MPDGTFSIEDPRTDDVRALLERHLRFARADVPRQDAHALDAEGLADPDVTLFGYRSAGRLLGVGALKRLDDDHAEIKSMHTAQAARGRGIGRAVVQHLIAVARERGFRRLSLETGAGPQFAPARRLYAAVGFVPCEPFAGYVESPNSSYMTLALDGSSGGGPAEPGS
jgi:putative acetyltransferase